MTGGASASGASDAFGMEPSSRYIRYSYLVFMVLCALSNMSWLYAFDHVVAFHMLYDLAGTLHMSCLHAFNHVLVNYMRIYDVTFLTLLFLYVIIFMLLFFWIKMTWKLPKYLTKTCSWMTCQCVCLVQNG
jgi:hypothetical protein